MGLSNLLFAGAGYMYGSGKSGKSSASSSSGGSANIQQPTILSVSPQNNGGMGLSNLLFAGALGAGAVMVLGGFQWLRRDDAVKKITPQIQKVQKSALKQVRK